MIEIDYQKSVVKLIGDFGFESSQIMGKCDGKHFKVIISSSPVRMNSEAKCVEGDLTRDQITEVLKNFNYMECKREKVIV